VSYPEPRYLGDSGETTATYRPAGREPDIAYAAGTTVHYLATGASTGGLFGLYRWDMGPNPSGPDPHFHRTIAESFFILSGSVRIYDDFEGIPGLAGMTEEERAEFFLRHDNYWL